GRGERANPALPEVVAAYGGMYQAAGDGGFFVTVESVRGPKDQAAAGARIALALRAKDPTLRQVLVTGRGGDGASAAGHLGDVFDSAVEQLLAMSAGQIRVDRQAAALIDGRFDIVCEGTYGQLGRGREAEGTRTWLGKPSLWVGRRRELAMLTATFEESAEERVARAVLVVA